MRACKVDAGTAQEQKPIHAAAEGRVDHVGLDHQDLIDEIGRLAIVGVNAADLGRGQDHVIDRGVGEEFSRRPLAQQIQLRIGANDQVRLSGFCKTLLNGRANHPAVAGDEDPAAFLQHPLGRHTDGDIKHGQHLRVIRNG